MADLVLLDGDLALFMPSFGAAVVVVQPGQLKGSGPCTRGGVKVCVEGDEGSVAVQGCSYMTPQYCIPGTGTLKVKALAADQVAQKTRTGGVALMLVGSQFEAVFEVQSPAQQPQPSGPPVPDATPQYAGKGSFTTTHAHYEAT
jgi:hypothetical protein